MSDTKQDYQANSSKIEIYNTKADTSQSRISKRTNIYENQDLEMPAYPACVIPAHYFEASLAMQAQATNKSIPANARQVLIVETWDGRTIFSSSADE